MLLTIDRTVFLLFTTMLAGLLAFAGCTKAGAAADDGDGAATRTGAQLAKADTPAAESLACGSGGCGTDGAKMVAAGGHHDSHGSGGMHPAGGAKHDDHGSMASASAAVGDPYPLDTCPVSGEKLGGMGEAVVYDYQGREIRFCCSGCIKDFEADPAKYISAIDKQIVSQQQDRYPLDTCLVSGEKLGGMGEAVDYVYNNRLFRLCCAGCKQDIAKDPAAYFAKLDAAVIKAQQADYPLDTCVVTGEKLGSMGDVVDYVYGSQLVRFCCAGCIKDFEADPAKYMAKIK